MPVWQGGVPIVGPSTPYVTPLELEQAPTGIAWSSIPGPNPAPGAAQAEMLNICRRASAMVDAYCNQPLRATLDTESVMGPGDFRCMIQASGVTRMIMSRSPVTQIVSAQSCPTAQFPRSWTQIPATMLAPEKPLMGVYGSSAPASAADSGGQAILLAPGYVSWLYGRGSTTVEVSYVNGWPHGSLTATAQAGDTTVQVDDCTGWAGAYGTLHDAGLQEAAQVLTASATSGPGTLTLSAPLAHAHQQGTLFTTVPSQVQWATILFACSQALTRGATATAVQGQRGAAGGSMDPTALAEEAELLIHPFRRVL